MSLLFTLNLDLDVFLLTPAVFHFHQFVPFRMLLVTFMHVIVDTIIAKQIVWIRDIGGSSDVLATLASF